MELELKHIYGYLPFGLSTMIYDDVCDHSCEIEGVDFAWEDTVIVERVNYKLSEIKPIMRPLSDLTNEQLHIFSVDFRMAHKSGTMFSIKDYITLNEADWLFKNHFDIYGLIENGLAVDINTLIHK